MDYNTTEENLPQDVEPGSESFAEGTVEQPEVDEDFKQTASLIPDGDYHKSPLFYEILNYLNIDKNDDYLHAEKISDITDYAIMKCKSNQLEDVLFTIRDLEDSMQPGLPGEGRGDRLANYVRLLSKKEGMDQKFKKLLSAYQKKPSVNDLSQQDQEIFKGRNMSFSQCELCDTDLMVKDVRGQHLCGKCTKLKPLIARYQNYKKRGLTKAEKERILSSRTTSAGPRSYGKR